MNVRPLFRGTRISIGARAALLSVVLAFFPALLAQTPTAPPIQIIGYGIDVVLTPATHSLSAKVAVSFTALQEVNEVPLDLNSALHVDRVLDDKGQLLTCVRVPSTSGIRVTPLSPLSKGENATWFFEYSGPLDGMHTAAAPTPSLASIGPGASYLLYAAHWFPVIGDGEGRFTAEVHVHVPVGDSVIGSGPVGAPKTDATGLEQFDFRWSRPGFPGTVIAGQFQGPITAGADGAVRVYLTAAHKDSGAKLAEMASRELSFFTTLFGRTESSQLDVVELPDGTVPATWAPGIAAIGGAQISGRSSERLLANTIARQWWSGLVSPETRNDAWVTNGMCRYAELLYEEKNEDKAAFSRALQDVAASALAYDTVPLASAGQWPPFSPEFEAETFDKGAMVDRMLRWEIGEQAFQNTLNGLLAQYADRPVSTADVEAMAEKQSQRDLRPFFSQWLYGTGAPEFRDNYTIYRLGNNTGFRTVGEVQQDLDLFRMPVAVRVETEGRPVEQTVDVAGPQTQYVVDTFGLPRKVELDPDNWLLKNSPSMQVRVHILRGQHLAEAHKDAGAIQEYQQAITIDSTSSLASYRLGDVYFQQKNYQAAADAYRDCLRGDGDPKWTQVWSHIQLGKVFDATGQRDRAVNEYRQALETNDNTSNALAVAQGLLQGPYRP